MKSHSLLMKLLVSFILMIIIPVAIIYGVSTHELMVSSEKSIGEKCVDSLKKADKGIQQLENSIDKDCINLSLNTAVIKMNNYENDFDLTDYEQLNNIAQVIDELIKMVNTDDTYYSIYLDLDQLDYIFTSDTSVVEKTSMTDSDWLKYYNDFKINKVPVSFINTSYLKTAQVYATKFIYPLTPYTTSLDGVVVINLKEDSICRIINDSENIKNGANTIIDKNGEVISNIDKKLICKNISKKSYISRILGSKNDSGYFSDTVGGEKSLVYYYKSGFNDWIYVGTASLSTLMGGRKSVNYTTLLLTAVLLLAGILIAYKISRKIYSPVNEVVETIKQGDWVKLTGNEDEISIIKQALSTIDTNNQNSVKEKDKHQLQEQGIQKLIVDGVPDDEIKSTLDEVFHCGSFVCALLSIDKYKEILEHFEEKQWKSIKSILMKLSVEIISESMTCVGCTVKKGEILLCCNFDLQCGISSVDKLKDYFDRIQKNMAKIFDNTITVGIGGIHQELTGIQESYFEAQIALKQKLKYGFGQIIEWDRTFSVNAYYYPLEMEGQIRNCLDFSLSEEISCKVNRLIHILKSREKLSCENVNQIITQLVGNTIIRYIIDNHINFDEVFGEEPSLYEQIASKETLDEIGELLNEKYKTLINYAKLTQDNKKIVDKIIDYIQTHYNKNIGINDISDYVNLSYSYVRKIFKDQIGCSIVDHINSIRIQQAKKMLMSRDLSIKAIAASLGYNNDQSFDRYFKKMVGVTPGEFRSKKETCREPKENTTRGSETPKNE